LSRVERSHFRLPVLVIYTSINGVLRRPVESAQLTFKEWQSFLGKHHLDASMSRRGNCYDDSVAESFFQLLKRETIGRRTYVT
tara:strand:+ start:4097 stop:4345 length:249 start_codon:yes stop_codon:yes gene_type:complete